MDKLKYPKSQYLKNVLDFLGFQSVEVSKGAGIDRSSLSKMVNGRQDVSKSAIEKLVKWKPEINLEYLMTGKGEMLKSSPPEKKLSAESTEEIAPEETFFNRNLPILLEAFEMSPSEFALLIPNENHYLTGLLDGSRGPKLSILIRLRALWGVGLDDMLFEDLSQEGAMEQLKTKKKTGKKLKKVMKLLEDLAARVAKMEAEKGGSGGADEWIRVVGEEKEGRVVSGE